MLNKNWLGYFSLVIYLAAVCPVLSDVMDTVRGKRSHKPPQCRDKFEAIRDHTMCIKQERVRPNSTFEALIENLHNDVRQRVSPAASNMMKVFYAKALTIEAKTWAEHCQFHHDDPNKRFIPGRYRVGQNILISPGKDLNWDNVIETWRKENNTFHYNKTGNSVKDVGNFTQMVWADTILVGCAKANCSGTFFYVCNYAPSMETNRLNTPYEKSSVNNCQGNFAKGTRQLCDCTGKFCTNGGVLNLRTCNCVCVQGIKTYNTTSACELKCDTNGDHSRCKSLTKASCNKDPKTVFLCPWMCDVCPYAGSMYHEGSEPMPWKKKRNSASTLVSTSAYVLVLYMLLRSYLFT